MPRIAMIADIEKAFLQVQLTQGDSHLVRFLWIKNPDAPVPEIIAYRWKRLPFGLTCSPFILRAVMLKHLDLYEATYPNAVHLLRSQLYVDDALVGSETAQQAQEVMTQLVEIFAAANMKLTKWVSNEHHLFDPTLQPSRGYGNLSLALIAEQSASVLGAKWDVSPGFFTFNLRELVQAFSAWLWLLSFSIRWVFQAP